MQVLTPSSMARAYLPVTRDAGRLLYTLARATRAQHIVEFGASFGISTIYLGAAARDNGGTLVTTEIEASKCRVTEANLLEAGLDDVVEVLEGDALETLARSATPIDMLFLDGWKDLYLPLLDQLRPRLESGALIVADNTNFRDAQPYVTHVRTPAHGFVSTTIAGGTMELSYLGS
jgi:predicted O-methyltransferase YrrM